MGFFLLSFVIILADDFVLLNKHYYEHSFAHSFIHSCGLHPFGSFQFVPFSWKLGAMELVHAQVIRLIYRDCFVI